MSPDKQKPDSKRSWLPKKLQNAFDALPDRFKRQISPNEPIQKPSDENDWRRETGLDQLRNVPSPPQRRPSKPQPMNQPPKTHDKKPEIIDWSEKEEYPKGFKLFPRHEKKKKGKGKKSQ